ncbi:hypothetical protein [Peptoniphilus raoultii]|uniref:hypothetical protein n=1 Tax=Peptoniphilus raoultii TaxID=1776387 RepID=UPI0008D9D9A6|nr:hypothetical protein [Peptoniphilus raoultii]
MILEKIEYSILNGLGYIVRLEKKNGSKTPLCGSFSRKIVRSTESSETVIFVSPTILGGKCEAFFISEISEEAQLQANPEN